MEETTKEIHKDFKDLFTKDQLINSLNQQHSYIFKLNEINAKIRLKAAIWFALFTISVIVNIVLLLWK